MFFMQHSIQPTETKVNIRKKTNTCVVSLFFLHHGQYVPFLQTFLTPKWFKVRLIGSTSSRLDRVAEDNEALDVEGVPPKRSRCLMG